MNRRQFSNPALAVAACLMLFVAAGSFAADPAPCEAGSRPCPPAFALNRYRIGPPQFALPFHLFNGHMLIDGAVNGHAGKFLFDTGTEFPFFLNNHFLALAKDQRVGSGKAASGQEMVLYRQGAPLPSLEIAGQLRFENLPGPVHTDWRFLEQAYSIPSFLGSIGHGFNQNYIFMLTLASLGFLLISCFYSSGGSDKLFTPMWLLFLGFVAEFAGEGVVAAATNVYAQGGSVEGYIFIELLLLLACAVLLGQAAISLMMNSTAGYVFAGAFAGL